VIVVIVIVTAIAVVVLIVIVLVLVLVLVIMMLDRRASHGADGHDWTLTKLVNVPSWRSHIQPGTDGFDVDISGYAHLITAGLS
jgi:hypothetical protein